MSSNSKYINNLYEEFHKNSKSIIKTPEKHSFTYKHIFSFIEKNVEFSDIKNVLDIGCGVGAISFYLSKKFKKINFTGIDVSNTAIRSCISFKRDMSFKNTNFILSSFENFKSKNTRYDLIIASEVIEHVYDEKKFLMKCNKLLRDNGRLIITTPSLNAPLYKLGILKNFDKRVGHLRRYNLVNLTYLLRTYGFSIKNSMKNEGILRNYLFTNTMGGYLLKVINRLSILGHITSKIDSILLFAFGESNIYIYAEKQ